MALLHSFGQRLRCATKSLISKSFTGEVSHRRKVMASASFRTVGAICNKISISGSHYPMRGYSQCTKCLGNWVRCATRRCCGEMFSLNLPRETLVVRENFEHLDGVLQILETDFSQRYSLRTKKTRSDETCDRWYLWSEKI
jgi:hypothetical protein